MFSSSATDITEEERRRFVQRRKLAKKTPEQRRALRQYHRRHNELDDRIFYCDYCDLFISTTASCRKLHLTSIKHMDNVEAYYSLLERVEAPWLAEINEGVATARLKQLCQHHHATAGVGAALPIVGPIHVNPHIIIGRAPQEAGAGVLDDGKNNNTM